MSGRANEAKGSGSCTSCKALENYIAERCVSGRGHARNRRNLENTICVAITMEKVREQQNEQLPDPHYRSSPQRPIWHTKNVNFSSLPPFCASCSLAALFQFPWKLVVHFLPLADGSRRHNASRKNYPRLIFVLRALFESRRVEFSGFSGMAVNYSSRGVRSIRRQKSWSILKPPRVLKS